MNILLLVFSEVYFCSKPFNIMGRIFEKRKHKMFARYAKMAKAFTRIGKEIAIAVKQGGPDPHHNAKLRQVMQNAKSLNMPKDRVDAAIKRASSKDMKDYEEITYEGYAPFGVAILVECATDNPTRTVANIRMHFNREEGNLGTSGSVAFMFERRGLFKFSAEGKNIEDLELELIDFGLIEIWEEDGFIYLYCNFEDFGSMTKILEDRNIEIISSELTRVPLTLTEVTEEQEQKIQVLIDRLEDDEDVQSVFHNMK
jgi:YebC/PmpR family DNA-binding regulatory protein